jgi:hypothetical protein
MACSGTAFTGTAYTCMTVMEERCWPAFLALVATVHLGKLVAKI